MRLTLKFPLMLALALALVGCGAEEPSNVDTRTADPRLDALDTDSVLAFLNGPDASVTLLVNDVRLQRRTARSIVRTVRGADFRYGTADDHALATLEELDAIKYVGPASIDALKAYVRSHYQSEDLEVEGVALSGDNALQMVALANTATAAVLDVDVALDSRAARAIMDSRPIANIDALAAVSYVGATALTHMRDWVIAHPSDVSSNVPPAEVPVPYLLQWINDYRGSGYVSRLNLNRDGTYDATVNGAQEHGVFFGPTELLSPIPLRLFNDAGSLWAANLTLYTGTSAEITRDGRSSTLLATLPTDGEDACDTGNGTYLDDDANSSGLYCECPDNQSWIPSQGGCVP